MIRFKLPIRTVSEANVASHEHWRERQKRAKSQKETAALFTRRAFAIAWPSLAGPVVVQLDRVAPRRLDSDNLCGSTKAVRDGIAYVLGVDDGDPRVEYRYVQRRGGPREYAVDVAIGRPEEFTAPSEMSLGSSPRPSM